MSKYYDERRTITIPPPRENCNCKDWIPGMERINDPIVLEQIRGGFRHEPGHFIPMKFCPWCGNKLREEIWR